MKIRIKISLKTIVELCILTLLLVFMTCQPEEPLRIGIWDQSNWDVDAWGD